MTRRRQPKNQLELDLQLPVLAPDLVARLERHGWRYLGTIWNEHWQEYQHKIQGPRQRNKQWGDSWIVKVDQGIAALLADLESE